MYDRRRNKMSAKSFRILVSQDVELSLDEGKFTPEFMTEFRESFFQFHTVEDHAEHLAQLYAREIVDNQTEFIEGYGDPADFGIKFGGRTFEISMTEGEIK